MEHFPARVTPDPRWVRCHCGVDVPADDFEGHLKTVPQTVSETVSETVYETCPTPHHTTPSNKGLGLGTSLRAGDLLGAATMTVLSLRPDWREDDVRAVLARDPRPWAVVVAAALHCALDARCEHPSRIETANPRGDALPTPTPPPVADVLAAIRRLDEEPQP